MGWRSRRGWGFGYGWGPGDPILAPFLPDPGPQPGGGAGGGGGGFSPPWYKVIAQYGGPADGQDLFFGNTWTAQTFTTSKNFRITTLYLDLLKNGSPGTVNIYIRATDGSGHPTGGNITSTSINGNALAQYPAWASAKITLPSGSLAAGLKYAIILSAPAGNITNSVGWRQDSSSPTYTGGNKEISTNAGVSWSSSLTRDMLFLALGVPG